MTIEWNKVTEKLPVEGPDYLVWTGHYMYVSSAIFYDKQELLNHGCGEEMVKGLMEAKGYFSEFGSKNYFDEEKVYWAELPIPPGQEPKPEPLSDPMEGVESKDIYLKKDGQIIGLHAVGYPGEKWTVQALDGTKTEKTGFMVLQQWGNEYDDERNMLGRGSFRLFGDMDEAAEEMVKDGWVIYEGPKKKETGYPPVGEKK